MPALRAGSNDRSKEVKAITVYFGNLRDLLARIVREESGQGLSEYALILFFVAIVCIAALTLLGGDIASVLSSIATSI
jgi:pilus assembly protein Flp/PilA